MSFTLDVKKLQSLLESEQDGGVLLEAVDTVNRVLVSSKGVSVEGDGSSVKVERDTVSISGKKVFLNASIENIFLDGVYKLNPELAMMIPSTTMTPIPVLKPAFGEKISGLLKNALALRDII